MVYIKVCCPPPPPPNTCKNPRPAAIKHDFLEIFEHVQNVTTSCDSSWLFENLTDWIAERLTLHNICLFVCLFVFNVPSTARSFRDGTPIYCPLRRTWSSVNTPSRPGIEPGAVAWQFITLPLRHGRSSTQYYYDICVVSQCIPN